MTITHKQHYVQQKYLKNWLIKNQFWVYDKQIQKIALKGTNAICFEKDYYKLYRLSDDERRFLDILYKKLPSVLSQRIYEFCDLMSSEVVIESNDENTRKILTNVFNENR